MKIEKWLGNTFESSCSLTPEYATFFKDIKKHIKDATSDKYDLEINRGHFYFYAFLKNKETGKYAYIIRAELSK